VRELEEKGAYWRRKNAELAEKGPELPYPTSWKGGGAGQMVMDTLYSETLGKGIRFIEDTAATSILTKGGKCVGATAINYASGEFLVIRAKAVILATGHTGYQYTYSTQSREVVGGGIAMAYRCGAELHSLEFQHWHHSDTLYPNSW
ncbi:hypothetical protein AKJ48_03435, partial [candidate division MSBL1 archaeon SCGC-AAA261O19]